MILARELVVVFHLNVIGITLGFLVRIDCEERK